MDPNQISLFFYYPPETQFNLRFHSFANVSGNKRLSSFEFFICPSNDHGLRNTMEKRVTPRKFNEFSPLSTHHDYTPRKLKLQLKLHSSRQVFATYRHVIFKKSKLAHPELLRWKIKLVKLITIQEIESRNLFARTKICDLISTLQPILEIEDSCSKNYIKIIKKVEIII